MQLGAPEQLPLDGHVGLNPCVQVGNPEEQVTKSEQVGDAPVSQTGVPAVQLGVVPEGQPVSDPVVQEIVLELLHTITPPEVQEGVPLLAQRGPPVPITSGQQEELPVAQSVTSSFTSLFAPGPARTARSGELPPRATGLQPGDPHDLPVLTNDNVPVPDISPSMRITPSSA